MKNFRPITIILLLLSLLLTVPQAAAADLSVFDVDEEDLASTFTDVLEDAWYYTTVAYCQTAGLLTGNTESTFAPEDTLIVAEAVTVAVRIYEAYYELTPNNEPSQDEPWYMTYVRRAEEYDLIPPALPHYDTPILRKDAARIFYRVLPQGELQEINEVHRIPGVLTNEIYTEAVFALYRAGILAGKDQYGSFDAYATLTRAELSSIIVSLVNPDYRHHFSLTSCGLEVFQYDPTTAVNPYKDISPEDWYYTAVTAQTQIGLMNGVGNGLFSPNEALTAQQTLALAVRLHEKYFGLTSSDYADAPVMAAEYGICTTEFSNYDAPINRAQAARILYSAIPSGEYYRIRQVGDIPDVEINRDSAFFPAIHAMYEAGVLSGIDSYGTFGKYGYFTRAQAATILTSITIPETRSKAPIAPCTSRQLDYGVSGSGKFPLQAYQLGKGENVIYLTYLVHGKGEICAQYGVDDGQAIYTLAKSTLELLRENYAIIDRNNWTVYLIPCVNPDGLFLGKEPYGVGRMTAYSYDDNGTLIPLGIDINRSFPHNWRSFSWGYANGEYYNGSSCFVTVNGKQSLRSVESQALLEFVTTHRGAGSNIIIDTHGFTNQILSAHASYVQRTFANYFPTHSVGYLTHGPGYFTSYFANLSRYVEGARNFDAHIFEFSQKEINLSNGTASIAQKTTRAYQAALLDILKNYN